MDIGITSQTCACGAELHPPQVVSPGAQVSLQLERWLPSLARPSGVSDSDWEAMKRRIEERRALGRAKIDKEISDVAKPFKSAETRENDGSITVRLERHEALIDGSEESGHLSLKCPLCGRVTFDWKRAG